MITPIGKVLDEGGHTPKVGRRKGDRPWGGSLRMCAKVPTRQAIRHARSRKGYWHMSKTIASGVGLTNAWLAEQGMLSMKTLWSELAPQRRTA